MVRIPYFDANETQSVETSEILGFMLPTVEWVEANAARCEVFNFLRKIIRHYNNK